MSKLTIGISNAIQIRNQIPIDVYDAKGNETRSSVIIVAKEENCNSDT